MGNSYKHENFRDSEGKFDIYVILDKGVRGTKSQISKVRIANLWIFKEEQGTHGR